MKPNPTTDLNPAAQDLVRRIAEDHSSGSVELARLTAKAMALAVRGLNGEEALRAAAGAGLPLMDLHSRMWAVKNVVARVLLAGMERDNVRKRILDECRRQERGLYERQKKAAAAAAGLLTDGTTVLTHSASGSVEAAIRQARRERKRIHLLATESRPRLEGVAQARRLRKAGCKVTLVVDVAAALMMPKADLVLVGADSVHQEGIANKIGTKMIASAARALGKPCYTVATTDKFAPEAASPPEETAKPGSEVLPGGGLEVANYYFEVTPWHFWSGIVTEDGVLAPSAARLLLDRQPGEAG